ncbi:MAG: N-acetylmuramoyl-L-alanine amidase [Anaerolineae bacterium]|nr:N-acetylmuramoyl-L-alanine amidase [Anaerolineae bacterium]
MPQTRKSKQNQAGQQTAARRSRYTMFAITMLVLAVVTILLGFKLFGPEEQPVIQIAPPSSPFILTVTPTTSQPTRDTQKPLVGIVAGHKGYDPGAVCDDGLTEAEINYMIALEVVDLLQRRGIEADLLDEYDDRLTEYQADALVSIHADSCNIPGATGFKVARVTNSAIPEAEDALVACLNQEYAIYTGLSQHPASITDNMTNYHAFNEIHPLTPGAIIEAGFLLDDRYLLEQRSKVVARGIAAGIVCFLGE